ncbi:MAG: hypothetical protein IPI55_05390 [Flavobacteriales bacterium]|nr:hypothetical protein [Flavobacteriales bacterium]
MAPLRSIRSMLLFPCASFVLSCLAQPYWAPAGLPGNAAPMAQVYANDAHDTIYYCGRTVLDTGSYWAAKNPVLRYAAGGWDTLGYIYTPIIKSVVLYHDTLIAGGSFIFLDDGTPAEGIAYWADSTWQLYGDLDHAVWKLRVLDDTLYAVGSFDMADGQPANGIARRQGGQWVPVGQLPADEMNWWDVTKYQGRLITLGNGYINGLRGIYELVNDEWSVLGPGFTGGISGAQSMVEFQGDLYVGGQILLQEGNAGQAIMRWDGAQFHPVGTGLQTYFNDFSSISNAVCMTVHDDLLWVGGGFHYASGVEAHGVATWDGERWCGVPGALFGEQWEGAYSMDFYYDTLFVACGDTADGQYVNQGAKFIGTSYVDSCGAPMGIPAIAVPDQSQLIVWPDASGQWSVIGAIPGMQPLVIYDAVGRATLRSQVRVPTDGPFSIDPGVLDRGAYVLSVGDRSRKVLVVQP